MVELILLIIVILTTIVIGVAGILAMTMANVFEKILIGCDTIIGVTLGITLIMII